VIVGTWTRRLAILAAFAAAGCNLLQDSSTSPSGDTNTTTFSGTLAPRGAPVFFTFTTAANGPVAVTLTSLTPSTTSGIGLGLGTPSGTTGCTLSNFTTSAVPSSTAQISVTEAAGSYCAQVYDPGNLASTTTFSISVSHS
jgi:hypothetical protein